MPTVDVTSITTADWPDAEDQTWEFKSSEMSPDKFAGAAIERISGFANSGGGYIVWGVDDSTGEPNDGVELFKGSQPIADWLDKKIHHGVQPAPPYSIYKLTDAAGRGKIDRDRAVIVIRVEDGPQPPYQATTNGVYYCRSGRHNLPAPHTLVEALWARRQVQKPLLGFAQMDGDALVTLVVCNITPTPAFDICVDGKVEEYRFVEDKGEYHKVDAATKEIEEVSNFLIPPAYLPLMTTYLVLIQPRFFLTLSVTYKDLGGNVYSDRYEGYLEDLVRVPQSVGATVARQRRELRDTINDLNNGMRLT